MLGARCGARVAGGFVRNVGRTVVAVAGGTVDVVGGTVVVVVGGSVVVVVAGGSVVVVVIGARAVTPCTVPASFGLVAAPTIPTTSTSAARAPGIASSGRRYHGR
jgi:hypothetical protein